MYDAVLVDRGIAMCNMYSKQTPKALWKTKRNPEYYRCAVGMCIQGYADGGNRWMRSTTRRTRLRVQILHTASIVTPISATMAAKPSSTLALYPAPLCVDADGGGGAVAVGDAGATLLDVLVGEPACAPGAEGAAAGVPENAAALARNAASVWSPESGGLMERTMPDLQSEPTDEKNLCAG